MPGKSSEELSFPAIRRWGCRRIWVLQEQVNHELSSRLDDRPHLILLRPIFTPLREQRDEVPVREGQLRVIRPGATRGGPLDAGPIGPNGGAAAAEDGEGVASGR